MSAETDEKPTPPVPPADHVRVRELDSGRTRTLEREAVDTCQCGGTIYYEEVATGQTMMVVWDYDGWDSETYKLSKTYERTERCQRCDRCGWGVDL